VSGVARAIAIGAWLIAVVATGCGGGGDDGGSLSIAELQDPGTCKECHPKHYTQWSGSMHAYASDDPVFIAMNKRGQRETGGALGTFCVKCHAPMAVELGLTDGVNFDPAQLPAGAKGITCYFCHNVKAVEETHNNGLVLANDQTMRGGLADPVRSPAHRSSYDKLMDSDSNQSELCGSCHDVVTPRGVKLERTYEEWQSTFFAEPDPAHHLTCGACHMPSSTDVIADAPGLAVKSRKNGFHEHMWPGIDQALTPFPELEAQAAAIKRDLDSSIAIVGPASRTSTIQPGGICLDPPGRLTVRIDSINVGHSWPSGAAQDRRAWLEVIAYDSMNTPLFSSGEVLANMDPEQLGDPNLFGLWDEALKDDGSPAHFFWDVASVKSKLLPPPTTLDKNAAAFDHSVTAEYDVGGSFPSITKITARVRIRPLSYAMLDDLISSGDLAPGIAGEMKTLDIVGATSTWTLESKGTGPAFNTNCNPQ
jgi:hypothetical protein